MDDMTLILTVKPRSGVSNIIHIEPEIGHT